jgi:hypothetical protein
VSGGRPSDYTAELAARICEYLSLGRSLKSICADPDMPCQSTIYLWMTKHEEFSKMYTRAREDQADTLADEIVDISDDSTNDYMLRRNRDGSEDRVVDQENIQRSRLRVEARKWVAAKLKPRKYGDRMAHVGEADAPIALKVEGSDRDG